MAKSVTKSVTGEKSETAYRFVNCHREQLSALVEKLSLHPRLRGTLSDSTGPFSVAPSGDRRGTGCRDLKMPEELSEAKTGGSILIFADELHGIVFRLREAALYSAEEIQEQTGEDYPEFGRWLPIEVEGEDRFAIAPGELISELQRLDVDKGDPVKVGRAQKMGDQETDPWEVNCELAGDEAQTRI